MAIILFDNHLRKDLYPLTQTRAVAGLRFGIVTVRERWEIQRKEAVYIHTAGYLQPLYEKAPDGDHTWVDASVLPSQELSDAIDGLDNGCCLADETGLIAGRLNITFDTFHAQGSLQLFSHIRDFQQVERFSYPWQLIQLNDRLLREDFLLLTKGRFSQSISATNQVLQRADVFIEAGASVECCIINAATGPVYIGKNAVVMEGTAIRGPFALGEGAVLKLNSRVYGATTLGPYCMGGGEIKNSIMMGYSNKAHDGYLGDSITGEWCNFGAGSTNSNIKNTAGEVKIWHTASGTFLDAGQKCGVLMGDYSRVAINSAINTGTVIGVSCNVFGNGLLPKVIPDFSWGTSGERYEPEKALRDIGNWKKLKGQSLSTTEALVLRHIFAHHL